MDLTFNLLLFFIDVVMISWVGWDRSRLKLLASLLVWMLVAIILSALLSRGPFHLMRLRSFVIFLHCPLVLLCIALLQRTRNRRESLVFGILGSVIMLVGLDAFLIEPSWLEVTTYSLASNKIKKPFSIAVVADIQTDRVGGYERNVLSRLKGLDVDMILMPGDYVHAHDAMKQQQVISELRDCFQDVNLGADLGVFATRGNVDDINWSRLFEGLPVTMFANTRSVDIGEVRITGLNLYDSFNPHLKLPQTERFHIVFGHAPDFALGDTGSDLLVAGHTHGGQVRLPILGPILTFSQVPRSWAAGMTKIGQDSTLVVSRGIGMERGLAPRLRFNCRPELVVINVVPVR
jgi:predicted MPP superfamily phosphohydrolase